MDDSLIGKLIAMLLVGLVIGVAVGQQFAAGERAPCVPPTDTTPTCTPCPEEVQQDAPEGTSGNFTVERTEIVAVPTPGTGS